MSVIGSPRTAQFIMVDKHGSPQHNGWLEVTCQGDLLKFQQSSPFKAMLVSRAALDYTWPVADLDGAIQHGTRWTVKIDHECWVVGLSEIAFTPGEGPMVSSYVYQEGDRRGDLVQLSLYPGIARFVIYDKEVSIPEPVWMCQLATARLAYAHIDTLPHYLSGRAAHPGAVVA